MAQGELRAVIRELLVAELKAIGHDVEDRRRGAAQQAREEVVTIAGDADLQALVKRVLELSKDPRARAELEAGRHRFRLAQPAPASAAGAGQATVTAERIERGLVTERRIEKLPQGLSVLQVGKQVRFTPLAQDELRRRGIAIERMKP